MAINDLGMVRPGSTLLVPWATYDSNDPAESSSMSGLALSDIGVYKGVSMTERASTAGIVLLDTDGTDLDGAVGIGGISIDLGDNTTAGFYSAGSRYYVTLASVVVDAGDPVNAVLATFEIGYPGALVNTTIASKTSQTQFIITDGAAEADVYNGWSCIIHDVASDVQICLGQISDYAVTTKEITLQADPGFTFLATDNISLFPPANVGAWNNILLPTTNPLPNVAAGADGGLPLGVDANGRVDVGEWLGATVATPTTAGVPTTALSAIGLDAIASTATGMVEIAKAVWDRVLTGATHNIATSAGRRLRALNDFGQYEGGAVWIDTVNGTAGTTDFENGTVNNPVDTIADAKTLADSIGLKAFRIIAGSTITLAATFDSFAFASDDGWTLALGGQSVNNTSFMGASVSGIFTGTPHFIDCQIGNITGPAARIGFCGMTGTITVNATGDWILHHCWSEVAGGASSPIFDWGAAVGTTNLNLRGYDGGYEMQNMGGTITDTASFDGRGQIILNANCSGGSYRRSGSWRLTDNAGGAVTETLDDNTANIAATLVDTNELQGDWTNGGRLDLILDAILAMLDDARGEPAQGAPPVNPDAMTKIDYIYKFLRNRVTSTATTISVFADNATTVDHKSTHSDDATTYDRGEFVSGP